MNLNIRWKSIDKSQAVQNHLEEKLAKVFEFQFVEDDVKVEFVHYPKEHEYKTRISLQIHGSSSIHSEASSKDILTSINESIEKAIDQLRRLKTKYNSNK